jgi:hypothetical protein
VLSIVDIDKLIESLLKNSRFAFFGVSCHLERNSDDISRVKRAKDWQIQYADSNFSAETLSLSLMALCVPITKFGQSALRGFASGRFSEYNELSIVKIALLVFF